MRGYCDICHNTGEVDCYCGGDFCVCGGDNGGGTNECPKCHGNPDDDEYDEYDAFLDDPKTEK